MACCSADTNLIAAGYEKTTLKNESTLLIWDITRAINPNSNRINRGIEATFMDEAIAKVEPQARPDLIFEPRAAFAKINEDVYSLSWLVDSKHELLFGTDACVKLCDIREYQSASKT